MLLISQKKAIAFPLFIEKEGDYVHRKKPVSVKEIFASINRSSKSLPKI